LTSHSPQILKTVASSRGLSNQALTLWRVLPMLWIMVRLLCPADESNSVSVSRRQFSFLDSHAVGGSAFSHCRKRILYTMLPAANCKFRLMIERGTLKMRGVWVLFDGSHFHSPVAVQWLKGADRTYQRTVVSGPVLMIVVLKMTVKRH